MGPEWWVMGTIGRRLIKVSHGTLLGFYLLFPEKMLDSFMQEFVPPRLIFFKDHSGCYVKGEW